MDPGFHQSRGYVYRHRFPDLFGIGNERPKVEEQKEIKDDQTIDPDGMGLPILEGLVDRPVGL